MSSPKQPTKSSKSGLDQVHDWFTKNHWEIFTFQKECWQSVLNGDEGILHAPTGSGKTFALWMPHIIRWLVAKKQNQKGDQDDFQEKLDPYVVYGIKIIFAQKSK